MIFSTLLKGCVIGFSIAMPVGPIGLLCIKNSLTRGMAFGLAAGIGAAFADMLFGILGGFGVSALSQLIADYHMYLEGAGALFLLYLGFTTFREEIGEKVAEEASGGYWKVFISTFFLTLTNPLTILSFAGVFAGLGVGAISNDIIVLLLIASGVFIGSAIWWLMLSLGSSCFKNVMSSKARKWLNRVSGSIIFAFGLFAAANLLFI